MYLWNSHVYEKDRIKEYARNLYMELSPFAEQILKSKKYNSAKYQYRELYKHKYSYYKDIPIHKYSYRDIARKIKDWSGADVHYSTISKWVKEGYWFLGFNFRIAKLRKKINENKHENTKIM